MIKFQFYLIKISRYLVPNQYIMKYLLQVIDYYSTNESLRCAAFSAGFIWSVDKVESLFTDPFSTTLLGHFRQYNINGSILYI